MFEAISARFKGREGAFHIPILALLSFLVLAGAYRAGFVGDDWDHLLTLTRRTGVLDIVQYRTWGEWEPVWYLSWALDYRIWKLNPLGYHVTDAVLNALCSILLYVFVARVAPAKRGLAFLASVFFLTQPVHDEALNYITARGHPIAAAFFLAALVFLVGFLHRNSWLNLALSLVCFMLAVGAKENALALIPFVSILAFVLRSGKPERASRALGIAVLCAAPYVVAAAGYFAIRMNVIRVQDDKALGISKIFAGGGQGTEVIDLKQSKKYLGDYSLLAFLPFPYAVVWYDTLEGAHLLGLGVLALILVMSARAFFALRRGGDASYALFFLGAALFLLTLAPVFHAGLSIRRRYLFLPSIGSSLVLASLVYLLLKMFEHRAWAKRAVCVVAGAVLVFCFGGHIHQNLLYAGSGRAAWQMIEDIKRETGTNRPAAEVVLVTMPRFWGGAVPGGAYLFHRTDLRSAVRGMIGIRNAPTYFMETCTTDDYSSSAEVTGPDTFLYKVRYRSDRSFETADYNKVGQTGQEEGRFALEVVRADPGSREVDFTIRLLPPLLNRSVFLFGQDNGRLYPIRLDRSGAPAAQPPRERP